MTEKEINLKELINKVINKTMKNSSALRISIYVLRQDLLEFKSNLELSKNINNIEKSFLSVDIDRTLLRLSQTDERLKQNPINL